MYRIKILRETIINIFTNFVRTKEINIISHIFYIYNVSFLLEKYFCLFNFILCSLIIEQFNNNIQLQVRFNSSKEISRLMPCFISSIFCLSLFVLRSTIFHVKQNLS